MKAEGIKGAILVAVIMAPSVWTGTACGRTNIYTFIPDRSTVVRSFFSSDMYNVNGQFQLTVDANAGAALFDSVNATFSEDPNLETGDLGELFFMGELVGDVVNDTTIEFELPPGHPVRQSYDIHIALTFQSDPVHLVGYRLPLMVGAPAYTLDAVAYPGAVYYVEEDAAKRVLVPTSDIGMSWAGASEPYDDSAWTHGTPVVPGKAGGVGYEDDSGFEDYISYDVRTEMFLGGRTSAYIRVPFTIIDANTISAFKFMMLRVRYDDGYVAYLNGFEVARRNAPLSPQWDSAAIAENPDSAAIVFEDVNVSERLGLLRQGDNILAIHGMNFSGVSSDFLISVELLAGGAPGPSIIYVDDDGPADFNNIQGAIDSAKHGDTIVVRDGIYRGAGNHDIDFRGKSITVRSENGPNSCIVDCEAQGRGFYFQSGENVRSVLEGLTIMNGSVRALGAGIFCAGTSPTIRNCILRDCAILGTGAGGGIACDGGSPTIVNCTVTQSSAYEGSGIYLLYSNATISRCSISQNGTYQCLGGGIYCDGSSPVITDCTITQNNGGEGGGGMYCVDSSPAIADCDFLQNEAEYGGGGGIMCVDCNLAISRCIFRENATDYDYSDGGGAAYLVRTVGTIADCSFSNNETIGGAGAGIFCFDHSNPEIRDCSFDSHRDYVVSCHGGSDPIISGCCFTGSQCTAVYISGSTPMIVNCEIVDNYMMGIETGGICSPMIVNCKITDNAWGGVWIKGGSPTVVNCTIADNHKYAGVYCQGGHVDVHNSILWWNTMEPGEPNSILLEGGATASVAHSDVQGGWPGQGNIDAAPEFVGPNNDYHLARGSPCIDAGDNTAIPGSVVTDLDGNPRVAGEAVDMGAYEFPFVCTWYVDAVGGSDSHDGRTPETAFATIQKGIDSAEDSDVVVVLAGTYTGPGNRDLDFKGKAITVRSTDPDDPNVVAATIIDCNGTALQRHRGFFFHSGEDGSSVLAGLTITNGHAYGGGAIRCERGSPMIIGCVLRDNWAEDGGGLDNYDSRPIVIDCVFSGNTAETGAGMYNEEKSDATVVNCIFSGNNATYRGGAIGSYSSAPTLSNCEFVDNTATDDGGGMHSVYCRYDEEPTLINCIFSGNSADDDGGGMYSESCSPILTNCAFTGNSALGSGGGLSCRFNSNPVVTNCTFNANTARNGGGMHNIQAMPALTSCTFTGNSAAEEGGAVYNSNSNPTLTNCVFNGNSANLGGGMANHDDTTPSTPQLLNCIFFGNSAMDGGGMFNNDDTIPTLINCAFSGNLADGRGAGIYNSDDGSPKLINCTFSGNVAAVEGGGLYNINEAHPVLHNCILYADQPEEIIVHTDSIVLATFSDIQGGWPGEGNIDAEPLLVDADGPDDIAGTEDDNLRLLPGSLCIDAGDNSALPPDTADLDGDGNTTEPIPWDLDGNPRILPTIVDMGAYEFQGPFYYYVNGTSGNDSNNGWSPEAAFATIQKGVSVANDGYTVWVGPGLYAEPIDFEGKAITLAGSEHPPILEVPDYYAVSFYHGEGPDSVFHNFVIKGSYAGFLCLVASPTITNVTVVNNDVGVLADAGANPYISNSIFWNNTEGDLFGCSATYSCIEHGDQGEGNIHTNPLFADSGNDDYHLRSERGRYWPAHDVWVLDEVTSPCVDAGDPLFDPMRERLPNGGRINMGAYGGTPYASMSEMPRLEGDINGDGIVNMLDLARLANNWLESGPTITGPNVPDTNPPAPPPTWTPGGAPRAISSQAITMTATISYDQSGVEYYFRCTSGGGHDSGWLRFPPGQNPTYTDVNLDFDTVYCYEVMARDLSPRQNRTVWSVEVCTITVIPP